MSSGYTSIQCHAGDGDDEDSKMFNDKFHNETSIYDAKESDDAMFPEEGDAGVPHALHLSTSVVKTNQAKSVSIKLPEPSSTNLSGTNNNVYSPATTSKSSLDKRAPPMITTPSLPFTPTPSTLDTMRMWTQDTLKYTKQYVSERLGLRTLRTIDTDTEFKIGSLRETQAQYAQVLRLAKALALNFQRVVTTQRVLGDAFGELSRRSGAELGDQFTCNAEIQKVLSKNGDQLLASLNVFVTSMTTLCNTTIEDTLATVKKCEVIRVKFDANRQYLENLRRLPQNHATGIRIQEAEKIFENHRQQYDRVHGDLIVKLKFLDENKVSVCQKHLYLLHKAFMNYNSGNRQDLEDVVKQFTIANPPTTVSMPPSGTL